jgi:protein-disulfide isomerase
MSASLSWFLMTTLRQTVTNTHIVLHAFRNLSAGIVVLGAAAVFAQADAVQALATLPGFDFSKLSPAAKKELSAVLTDEFDYCGRPLTVMAALKKGNACGHTRRLVGLAAKLADEGTPSSDILLQLSRYNQAFAKSRQVFKVDDRMCAGPKESQAVIVEFSDFECPHCAAARPILKEFVKQKTTVRLCYMPFPLQGHPYSTLAGQAALFARDQGKFWKMHDALFENQLALSEGFIKQLVAKHDLDVKAFAKAVENGQYVDELEATKEAGRLAGVEATPAVFINGRKLVLNLSIDVLGLALEDETEWLAGNRNWPSN